MIKITIVIAVDDLTIVDVTGLCADRKDISTLIEHMMSTEPMSSAPHNGTFGPITITLSKGGGVRRLPTPAVAKPGMQQLTIATKQATRAARLTKLARTKGTYIEPPEHMTASDQALRALTAHRNFVQYLDALSTDIIGVDIMKAEALRLWWQWYDHKTTGSAILKWVAEQSLTVRHWLAQWLMVQFERLDYRGRQERVRVQQQLAALKANRQNIETFDKNMASALLTLRRLTTL